MRAYASATAEPARSQLAGNPFEALGRAREVAAYDEYMARYPDDYTIPNNAALRYDTRRQFTHAESLYRRSIALQANNVLARGNLLRNLVSQGRLDEAEKIYEVMQRRFAGSPGLVGVELPIL